MDCLGTGQGRRDVLCSLGLRGLCHFLPQPATWKHATRSVAQGPSTGLLDWSLVTIIASLWVRGDLPGYKNGAPVHSPFTSTMGYRRSRMKKAKELSVVMYEMDLGGERGVSVLVGAHPCERD